MNMKSRSKEKHLTLHAWITGSITKGHEEANQKRAKIIDACEISINTLKSYVNGQRRPPRLVREKIEQIAGTKLLWPPLESKAKGFFQYRCLECGNEFPENEGIPNEPGSFVCPGCKSENVSKL